jgi:putative two-component system response regulator
MTETEATILIVDDTPMNIDVLESILSGRYSVRSASNAELALRIMLSTPQPDLVLLDVMMPDIDGYELCRQLKASEFTSTIPVIFVTAMHEIEDETRGFDVGCVDYIIKPISAPLVLARVATHIKLYRQEQQLQGFLREPPSNKLPSDERE